MNPTTKLPSTLPRWHARDPVAGECPLSLTLSPASPRHFPHQWAGERELCSGLGSFLASAPFQARRLPGQPNTGARQLQPKQPPFLLASGAGAQGSLQLAMCCPSLSKQSPFGHPAVPGEIHALPHMHTGSLGAPGDQPCQPGPISSLAPAATWAGHQAAAAQSTDGTTQGCCTPIPKPLLGTDPAQWVDRRRAPLSPAKVHGLRAARAQPGLPRL